MARGRSDDETTETRTVDGPNPAPPGMLTIPWFLGFQPSQVVQDFMHQQYQFTRCWFEFCHVGSLGNPNSWTVQGSIFAGF